MAWLAGLLERSMGAARSVDALAVLLAAKREGRLGRPRLQRLLGIGERRARNLLDRLAELGLLVKSPGGSSLSSCAEEALQGVHVVASGDSLTCCLVEGRRGGGSVVEARDRVAILLGDASALTVMGYAGPWGFEAPGVPGRLASYVLGVAEAACGGRPRRDAVYAVFRRRLCYRCCASFIHAALASSMLAVDWEA